MSTESVAATLDVPAPADVVFALLARPAHHAAIDGTGWVTACVDAAPLTTTGQLFRMAMHHPDHPDGDYETVNEVLALAPGAVLQWRTGYVDADGALRFGGWTWRYDLAPATSDVTRTTLTYDWSAVGPDVRTRLAFPPFGPDHLPRSLRHLAALVDS